MAASFNMGSERFYPEEGPVREAHVGDFFIDRICGDKYGVFEVRP